MVDPDVGTFIPKLVLFKALPQRSGNSDSLVGKFRHDTRVQEHGELAGDALASIHFEEGSP